MADDLLANLKDAYETRDGYLAELCGDAAEEIERLLSALHKAEGALSEMGDSYAINAKPFDAASHLIENANLEALSAIRAAIAKAQGR